MMRNTVSLVLAGGINLGFSVLTHNRAKSALPFCGHFRVVDFVLTNLSRSGINNVGIMIQYLPGSLIDHIGVGRAWDYGATNRRLKLMPPFVGMGKTEWFRGSADAIYQNLNFVTDHQAEHVLIVCADHVYSMDYRSLMDFHVRRNADLTIMTTQRPKNTDPDHYGYVTSDNWGRVEDFVEKPDQPPHETVSTGVYLFKADVLCERLERMRRENTNHHLPTTVVEPLVEEGRVFAYFYEEDWNYLPDIEAYVAFHQRLLKGQSTINPERDQVVTELCDRDLGSRPAPYFGPLSEIQDSLISPGCVIEGTVVGSVLSPGVRVAPKAVVRDCILFHDCQALEGSSIQGVVSDKDAVFHGYCHVGGEPRDTTESLFRNLTVVGKGAQILQGVRVWPGSEIPVKQVVSRDWEQQNRQTNLMMA